MLFVSRRRRPPHYVDGLEPKEPRRIFSQSHTRARRRGPNSHAARHSASLVVRMPAYRMLQHAAPLCSVDLDARQSNSISLPPQAQLARALNASSGITFSSGMMRASCTQYAVYA